MPSHGQSWVNTHTHTHIHGVVNVHVYTRLITHPADRGVVNAHIRTHIHSLRTEYRAVMKKCLSDNYIAYYLRLVSSTDTHTHMHTHPYIHTTLTNTHPAMQHKGVDNTVLSAHTNTQHCRTL